MAKILVVDDSQVIRSLLTDFLGELGHRIDVAVDGVDGLEKARRGDYDLCICDLHLPRMNGFQLLTELGHERDRMQFIFTDSLPDDLYEQVKTSTSHLCIRKPFDLVHFRDVVERALDRVRSV
jgi:two-component system nitrogen regulation response regulator NtrX